MIGCVPRPQGDGTLAPGGAGMRQGPSVAGSAVAGAAVLAGLLMMGVPASAQESGPRVGECYDLVDAELTGTWVEAAPVACDGRHTLQVTSVVAISPDADPVATARQVCGALGVWNEVGVNRPVAGLVREPLRIEPRAFAVRGDEPVLACGASVVAWDPRGRPGVVDQPTSLDALGPRALAALRHCIEPTASPQSLPAPTVPCDRRPRWQVDSWILWTAFHDGYPGRAVLKAQARRLCGEQARFSVPTRTAWAEGLPRTWCLTRVT